MDFTLKTYKRLIETLLKNNYRFYTLNEFLTKKTLRKINKRVVLRHDVDRWIRRAQAMAQLEYKLGIKSSYYFRYPHTFTPSIVKKIHDWNHEAGIHYECVDQAKGDLKKARKLLAKQLQTMRQVTPVTTAAMHGNPLSPHNNRNLLKKYPPESFDLKGEAYLSINFKNLIYFSDTGRTWHPDRFNFKDKPPGKSQLLPHVSSTQDLIKYLQKRQPAQLYITTHPERWAKSFPGWIVSYSKDLLTNSAKFGLGFLKKSHENYSIK